MWYQNLKGSPDKILNIGNKKDFEKIGSKTILWEQNFKVLGLWSLAPPQKLGRKKFDSEKIDSETDLNVKKKY